MRTKDHLNIKIINRNFEFSDFFDACDRYGRKKRLDVKEINMIQLMIEEIVVNHLCMHADDITFSIMCEKNSKDVEISIDYEGDPYNPYRTKDKLDLSRTIIMCLTKKCIYHYDGSNHLKIHMQLGIGEDPEIIEE